LIPRGYWADVAAAAEADHGARAFLAAHRELITLVECGDVARPDDLDTEEDLHRIAGLISVTDKPPIRG
jgi:CTP:molybdopterin cytidylyltransferase MocA